VARAAVIAERSLGRCSEATTHPVTLDGIADLLCDRQTQPRPVIARFGAPTNL